MVSRFVILQPVSATDLGHFVKIVVSEWVMTSADFGHGRIVTKMLQHPLCILGKYDVESPAKVFCKD